MLAHAIKYARLYRAEPYYQDATHKLLNAGPSHSIRKAITEPSHIIKVQHINYEMLAHAIQYARL